MSWLNRIRSTASRAASNVLSGARRLALSVIPEPVQRRVTDFGNWLTGRVGPEQTPQVLNEIVEHVRTNYPPRQSFEVREINSALRNFARVYTINGIEGYDARSFVQDASQNITSVYRNNRRTKVKLILKCNMQKRNKSGETVIQKVDFHSNIGINLDGTDEKELYEIIIEKIASYQAKDTGSSLRSIIRLELHTVRYNPLRGETYIPLPKELANKKAIINIKNKDNQCFLWCVLRALYPKDKDPQRITDLINKKDTLKMEGIEYPMSLKELNKFEKQNPTISITVLGYERKGVYPLRNSNCTDRDYNIILMLIEEGGVKHYCLVNSLSRLLASQVPKNNGKHYFCLRYLNPFWCQESLCKHKEYCNEYEAVKIVLPEKGTMLKYKHYHRLEKVPFIIYADFESYIKPLQSCDPNPESSYTK